MYWICGLCWKVSDFDWSEFLKSTKNVQAKLHYNSHEVNMLVGTIIFLSYVYKSKYLYTESYIFLKIHIYYRKWAKHR